MHKQHMKLRIFTATEIANMVPWQGQYVPLDDVKALLERLTDGNKESFDLDLDDGTNPELES